ncbi:HTH domain-containing protein, partial [Streptococcus sobrinus]
CKELNISSRTLRNDIKTINDYISNHGAEIELVRKKGYKLIYTDKEEFELFWHHDDKGTFLFTSAKNRIDFLLRIFLTTDNYVTQEYLLNTFFISQNTLHSDFRALKKLLEPYQIQKSNKSNLGYFSYRG